MRADLFGQSADNNILLQQRCIAVKVQFSLKKRYAGYEWK